MLRGINVSGQKKIKMDDLRQHFNAMGFENVATYIQSGNIVFDYSHAKTAFIQDSIENMIQKKYSWAVPAIVKTTDEIKRAIEKNPFTAEKVDMLYITFLAEKPKKESIDALNILNHEPEEFIIRDNIIYLYSPLGYGRAKMNNNFFENKLKVSATTRNWKTVNKLFDMSQST